MPRLTRTRHSRRPVPEPVRRLLLTGIYDSRDAVHGLRCWELHKCITAAAVEPPEMTALRDELPATAWCFRALREARGARRVTP